MQWPLQHAGCEKQRQVPKGEGTHRSEKGPTRKEGREEEPPHLVGPATIISIVSSN